MMAVRGCGFSSKDKNALFLVSGQGVFLYL